MTQRALAVAYGGGINSTAMCIGLAQRDIIPKSITFADTGGERPAVYAYLTKFSDWLEHVGLPRVVVVRYVPPRAKYRTLEENCLMNGALPSLAYGYRSCSEKWKVRPQNAYLKSQPWVQEEWAAQRQVVVALGFDAGESHRARQKETEKYQYRYPLLEWEWDREDCQRVIAEAGLPLPEKSACFFCPASKKQDIQQLASRYPELYQRALAIEDGARSNLTAVKGLGRSFSWRDVETVSEGYEKDIPCGCYDG